MDYTILDASQFRHSVYDFNNSLRDLDRLMSTFRESVGKLNDFRRSVEQLQECVKMFRDSVDKLEAVLEKKSSS